MPVEFRLNLAAISSLLPICAHSLDRLFGDRDHKLFYNLQSRAHGLFPDWGS